MDIHYYSSTSNTNSTLLELSKKSAKSWTAIWTDNQTQGRGYAGNSWTAEPGQNIALSLLIINDLNYDELLFFNQWVSNCVASVLKRLTADVFVKWPNDIIAADKKLCGILIETRRSGNQMFIVTGIGLNVNQTNFENHPKAASLGLICGCKFDLKEILSGLLTALEENYHLIENRDWETISKNYISSLYRKDIKSLFRTEEGEFEAIIRSVSDRGELILELTDGNFRNFAHKSIELVY